MNISVVMPQLGESVTEGEVTRWLKAQGDSVERDEAIVEIKTDKATVEVPSPASGTLAKILSQEGDKVQVGTRIAEIAATSAEASVSVEKPATKARKVEVPTPQVPEPHPAAEMPPAKEPPARRTRTEVKLSKPEEKTQLRMTPLARRLISEFGVDASAIHGTGARGKITREDVMNARERGGRPEAAAEPEGEMGQGTESVPLSPMRRRIAARMLQSAQTIPQVTTVVETDMTRVAELREKHKKAFERDGLKLTYLPFLMASAAGALMQFREVNASWGGEKLILHSRVHLGIAVAVEGGLAVPVIRNADGLSLRNLARRLAEVADHARAGRLTTEEAQGSTFTITNPGLFGAVVSTPLVNPPNAAILGVCRIAPAAVVLDGKIAVRTITNLCLSYDHRIVDGETALKFLQHMRKRLEAAAFDSDG